VNAYIVTEGEFHTALLSRLLAEEISRKVRVVSASTRSGARSLARSLVATRRRPVALVLDARTTDETLIREELLVTREFLAMASPGIPTEVFMAVPSVGVLLFKDRGLLPRLVPGGVSEDNWVRGRYEPEQVLQEILRIGKVPMHDPKDLVRSLTDDDVAQMRKHSPVSEILAFLQETALTGAVEAPS